MFCPGDVVTYTCDVGTAIGNTKWSFSEGNCINDGVTLQQNGDQCASSKGVCGAFNATNTEPEAGQSCTVSVVTVELSKVANGTVIKCLNVGLNVASAEVGNATILKDDTSK